MWRAAPRAGVRRRCLSCGHALDTSRWVALAVRLQWLLIGAALASAALCVPSMLLLVPVLPTAGRCRRQTQHLPFPPSSSPYALFLGTQQDPRLVCCLFLARLTVVFSPLL